MFDIGTTAVLLDAAQDLNEALQGGAALSLIPIGIGTIVGIGIVGFFAHHFILFQNGIEGLCQGCLKAICLQCGYALDGCAAG